jgi:hypothetical protein
MISQRMVVVMRPSIGEGVTDCRIARKLMNSNVAPEAKPISIKANPMTAGTWSLNSAI